MALGFTRIVSPGNLVIGVNTGDDECFHGLHVSGGVVLLLSAWWKTRRGPTPAGLAVVEHVGLYWHFVDLIWILVFTFVYLL